MLGTVDGRGGGDEEDAVEGEMGDGVLRRDEVAEMNGVERSSDDADALGFHGAAVCVGAGGLSRLSGRGETARRCGTGRLVFAALAAVLAAGGSAGGEGDEPASAGGGEAVETASEAPEGASADEADLEYEDAGESAEDGERRPSPFGAQPGAARKDAVPGTVALSDGRKVAGRLCTTRGKRLVIYNFERERYEHVPVPALERMEAVVEWERMEREWRFKEAGNPEKVYSGRTYPARRLAWRLRLRNGHEIVGHILGQPLYVLAGGERARFVLHKRQKGPVGTALEDLVYVREAVFGEGAYRAAVEELAARAREAEAGREAAGEQGGAE